MPDRITPFVEPIVVMFAMLFGGQLVLAEAETNHVSELRLLIVPMIASVLVSCFMMLLGPQNETRRIIAGRAMFGGFFGSVGPSVLAFIFPSWAGITVHPIILGTSGAVICIVAYACSKPLVQALFGRSEKLANTLLDVAENKLGLPSDESKPNPPQ